MKRVLAMVAGLACIACQPRSPALWHEGAFMLSRFDVGCELRYGAKQALSIRFDRAIGNFELRAINPAAPAPTRPTPVSLSNGRDTIEGQAFPLADGDGVALWPTDPAFLHDFLAQGQNGGRSLTLAAGPIRAAMPLDDRFAEGWEHFEECLRGLPR